MADETTSTPTPAPAAPAAPEPTAPAAGGFFDPPATEAQEPTAAAPEAAPAESPGTRAGEGVQSPDSPAELAAKPPEAPKAEDKPSPQLAALMKQEAEIRKAREELKAREEKVATYEAKRKKALENPLDALAELGLDYDKITDYVLNGNKLTPAMQEAARIAKIEEQLGAIAADQAAQEAARREATVSTFKSQIRSHVAGAVDKFEYIHAQDAHALVFDVVNQHYASTGEMLGGTPERAIELAAEQVEKYLEERAERLLTTKKLKSKVSTVTPPSATETAQRPQVSSSARQTASPSRPTTLTNSQAAAVPPRAPKEFTSPEETMRDTLASGLRLFDE